MDYWVIEGKVVQFFPFGEVTPITDGIQVPSMAETGIILPAGLRKKRGASGYTNHWYADITMGISSPIAKPTVPQIAAHVTMARRSC